jgi:hypothetical protein
MTMYRSSSLLLMTMYRSLGRRSNAIDTANSVVSRDDITAAQA